MSPHQIIDRIRRKAAPRYVDLHVHTTISDGLLTPEEIVRLAHKMKYRTIALTDHDTIDGVRRARKEATKYNLEVIAGCELTAYFYNHEMHILAYYVDLTEGPLLKHLEKFKTARIDRAAEIIKKLNKIGIDITLEEVLEKFKTKSIGRPHIARLIVEKGYEEDEQIVFQKYLVPGAPAYVPKYYISPKELIGLILESGAVPVLAHPYYYFGIDTLIKRLVKYGLKGIEVYHPYHSTALERKFKNMAKEYNLVITGGSDAHSSENGAYLPFGTVRVSRRIVKKLREVRNEIYSEMIKAKNKKKNNIVLTGMMGSGKSEVGKILAKKLEYKFIDTDELIEKQTGMKISDIFKNYGEEFFRKLELKISHNLKDIEKHVIATGGGMVLNQEIMQNFKKNGIIINLKAEPEILWKRLKEKNDRPLLKVNNPLKELKKIYENRKSFYQNADIIIDNSKLNIEETANKIIEELNRRGLCLK